MHKLTTKPLRDTKATLSIGESKKTLTGLMLDNINDTVKGDKSKFYKFQTLGLSRRDGDDVATHDEFLQGISDRYDDIANQMPIDTTNTTKHTP